MKFNHSVVVNVRKDAFADMLTWLDNQGHVLRETVDLGSNTHSYDDPVVKQKVWFRDANDMMLFKLAWGGK